MRWASGGGLHQRTQRASCSSTIDRPAPSAVFDGTAWTGRQSGAENFLCGSESFIAELHRPLFLARGEAAIRNRQILAGSGRWHDAADLLPLTVKFEAVGIWLGGAKKANSLTSSAEDCSTLLPLRQDSRLIYHV
jgi:hypothetical protein